MEGKIWKEKHYPYNFTSNHQTFTVTRILNERERVPHPDFVNNVSFVMFLICHTNNYSLFDVIREATTTMDLQVTTQSLLRLKLVEVASSQQ